jgi:hypothetical protein
MGQVDCKGLIQRLSESFVGFGLYLNQDLVGAHQDRRRDDQTEAFAVLAV